MKRKYNRIAALSLCFMIAIFCVGAQQSSDKILQIIKTEVDRNLNGLRKEGAASPFYIDYRLVDTKYYSSRATLGNLIFSNIAPYRFGYSTVLAGDYMRNNSNVFLNINQYQNFNSTTCVLGDEERSIRLGMWQQLDRMYKESAELYGNKLGLMNQMSLTEEELSLPDFEQREAFQYLKPETWMAIDKDKLDKYVKDISVVLKEYPELNDSYVNMDVETTMVRYYNTEGTLCMFPQNMIFIRLYMYGVTADGQDVMYNEGWIYRSIDDMPDVKTMSAYVRQHADMVKEKLNAQMIDDAYNGPVLFEGKGVVDLFSIMVNEYNGLIAKRKPITTPQLSRYYQLVRSNDLEGMVNKKIISRNLTITSMSGSEMYDGKPLVGYIPVDAQGVVPDKELVLVEDGVLKSFLNNRVPKKSVTKSNGHFVADMFGQYATIRPGVLRMSAKETVSSDDLKQKLLDAAKEEDYDYAYIVRRLEGDSPALLYRVSVKDGSETQIRGAEIRDIMLRSLKRVIGVSNKEFVYNVLFNNIPSTYILPTGILLEDIDIVKDSQLQLKKPYVVPKPEMN